MPGKFWLTYGVSHQAGTEAGPTSEELWFAGSMVFVGPVSVPASLSLKVPFRKNLKLN